MEGLLSTGPTPSSLSWGSEAISWPLELGKEPCGCSHSVQYTLCTVQYTLYTVHYTLYTVNTVYNSQCTLCSADCILFTVVCSDMYYVWSLTLLL